MGEDVHPAGTDYNIRFVLEEGYGEIEIVFGARKVNVARIILLIFEKIVV